MFTMRGVPTVDSGDEQGFVGKGRPIRASRCSDRRLQPIMKIGCSERRRRQPTEISTSRHPLYTTIAKLAKSALAAQPCVVAITLVHNYAEGPGLFAFSRIDKASGEEVLNRHQHSTATALGQC